MTMKNIKLVIFLLMVVSCTTEKSNSCKTDKFIITPKKFIYYFFEDFGKSEWSNHSVSTLELELEFQNCTKNEIVILDENNWHDSNIIYSNEITNVTLQKYTSERIVIEPFSQKNETFLLSYMPYLCIKDGVESNEFLNFSEYEIKLSPQLTYLKEKVVVNQVPHDSILLELYYNDSLITSDDTLYSYKYLPDLFTTPN